MNDLFSATRLAKSRFFSENCQNVSKSVLPLEAMKAGGIKFLDVEPESVYRKRCCVGCRLIAFAEDTVES